MSTLLWLSIAALLVLLWLDYKDHYGRKDIFSRRAK